MEKSDSRDVLLSVFGVALLIIAVAGISYAIFTFTKYGTKENIIKTGAISMSFVESSNNIIKISDALPMSDEVGKVQNEYFDFSVSATISGSATVFYEIRAKKIDVDNPIDSKNIKMYLEKKRSSLYIPVLPPTNFSNSSVTTLSNPKVDKDSMLLYSNKFVNESSTTQNYEENYRLRMWIDENGPIESSRKNFKVKVNVYANI